ncbi:helix-turn-helix domain-containing protein [Formosa haliotis]|uniref:helix-turn-helix domain-containing protein n=1 Tax=Formosa haliotis TaxID=1555194 RepID=UPI00082446F1|nr:helix-turn-helix domain-containing protein [Formosa haliotis]
MATSIVTTEDLIEFRAKLLQDIKTLLSNKDKKEFKKHIRSSEVMNLLNISPGTLQNFRINGTIPYTKIGNIIYYKLTDIQKILEENRISDGGPH